MKSTDRYQFKKCPYCDTGFEQSVFGPIKTYCNPKCAKHCAGVRYWIREIMTDLAAGRNPLGDGEPEPLKRIIDKLNPFNS